MNAAYHRLFGRFIWFVTGLSSLAIGFQAAGLDVIELLYLFPVSPLVLYGVALCGAISLIMFFADCSAHCGGK